MATYKINMTQMASAEIEVEADSLDEAIEAAYQEGVPSICAQCSGWGQKTGIDLSGDWEADEKAYVVDGEYVEVPDPEPFKPTLAAMPV